MDIERGALIAPDLGVFFSRFFRPYVQNHAVQYQPPDQPRNLNHAAVAEKLLEIGAQRLAGRRFGGAEIDQQDADAKRVAVCVGRFVQIISHRVFRLFG